jgi:hypothetical protein
VPAPFSTEGVERSDAAGDPRPARAATIGRERQGPVALTDDGEGNRATDTTIAGRGFAMIDDMASLKQAMEQMDADDAAVAQAAKDRAAQILSDAKLSFSKMAELIEQRRLLLRPKIVASIKRMDQPEMLGDAAFRDAGTSLRREGQGFRQIAEALELNGGASPRYEEPVHRGELLHQLELEGEPGASARLRALNFALRVVFYPFRHPIRFLVIALVAFMLFNTVRGFVGVGRQVSGYVADVSAARQRADSAMSSVSSFVEKRIMRPSQDATAPPTPPAPIPSSSAEAPSATPSTTPAPTPAPPVTAAAPSTNEAATPAAPPAAPAAPPASTSRLNAKSAPVAKSAANDRSRMARMPAFDDLMPQGMRRNSRVAGPCVGGAGGCYWGGGRY